MMVRRCGWRSRERPSPGSPREHLAQVQKSSCFHEWLCSNPVDHVMLPMSSWSRLHLLQAGCLRYKAEMMLA